MTGNINVSNGYVCILYIACVYCIWAGPKDAVHKGLVGIVEMLKFWGILPTILNQVCTHMLDCFWDLFHECEGKPFPFTLIEWSF